MITDRIYDLSLMRCCGTIVLTISTALYILADGVQFFRWRIAGHNINGAHFSPLIGGYCVLAKQLNAYVTDENGYTCGQNAYNGIHVDLYDDPGKSACNAHGRYENNGFRPMIYGKAFLPIQSVMWKKWRKKKKN